MFYVLLDEYFVLCHFLIKIFYFFIYIYITIILYRLEDFENSCAAYEKSVELSNGADYLIFLNYAITLCLNDEIEKAKVQFGKYENLYLSISASDADPEVSVQANIVRNMIR